MLAAAVAMIKRVLRQSFLHCFHSTRSSPNITVIQKGKHSSCALLLVLYILQNTQIMLFYKMLKSLVFCFLKYKREQVLLSANWRGWKCWTFVNFFSSQLLLLSIWGILSTFVMLVINLKAVFYVVYYQLLLLSSVISAWRNIRI